MSNIIPLFHPQANASCQDRIATLLAMTSEQRRKQDDVFWLKENAEILNVLQSTNADVGDFVGKFYNEFYDDIEQKLQYFPQYYRFFLSIAMDLEDLGIKGEKSVALGQWVADQELVMGELSDLQRAEARRLLARRDIMLPSLQGLDDRLMEFIETSATFALPNKKAAYELTHIIFYLSEYGRHAIDITDETLAALHFTGILAMLEQNADLLSEVCIALSFAGKQVPEAWSTWVLRQRTGASVQAGSVMVDDYHAYLMCEWFAQLTGARAFEMITPQSVGCFVMPKHDNSVLRVLSQNLMQSSITDTGDMVSVELPDMVYETLEIVSQSTPYFDRFFAKFTRQKPIVTGAPGMDLMRALHGKAGATTA